MNKLYSKVLTLNTKKSLKEISSYKFLSDFYLGGGTALALHLGHMMSKDLDFFSTSDFNDSLIIQYLSEKNRFSLEKRDVQTIIGIFNTIKISFLKYSYLLLAPPLEFQGIKIAAIPDIICMKIEAISTRGSKRDFIDLYFALKNGFSLSEALKLFETKYASVKYNMTHIFKSLVYFTDADNEPPPIMIKKYGWDEIKTYFIKEVSKHLK
ncbi:MAG: hypothetical protein DDT42_01165 [candidate division WS2 bacterium]|uniref:Nucleotidyl transferase AbiEii/AbiGii toxin family protein n=1 Tax=Psychracetigena formicireducens TaxID=2986056 RepID=A0A9E2BGS4_PSYF1|nr:hypothetical protein [Candidatus Psychracetigena formicireducens]MBT9145295.1 hypothetical protein [Candidatus Psychracetigena formicireducens]